MHIVVFILFVVVTLTACNNKPTQKEITGANTSIYNTEKPTSFAEYKAWRKENDPASEAYAEFKEWEINYRRWKQLQDQ